MWRLDYNLILPRLFTFTTFILNVSKQDLKQLLQQKKSIIAKRLHLQFSQIDENITNNINK